MTLPREFERIREQIFQNLLQSLRIAYKCGRERRIDIDAEGQVLRFRDVMESALDAVADRCERNLLGLDGNRSRLDFRQIENVINKGHEIRSRGMNVLGEIHLFCSEISTGIFRELLSQYQDRVQRRSQFM